jgi:Flp pilus assembly protein TadD
MGGWRGLRLMGFGGAWFFLTLSVESSVIPLGDVIFEHRVYLPLAGVLTAFATACSAVTQKGPFAKSAVYVLVAALVLALSAAAHTRNAEWADGVTFWEDTVGKSPSKIRPNFYLAKEYESNGLYEKAISGYSRVIAGGHTRSRYNIDSHNNLGIIYAKLGRLREAHSELRLALKSGPDNADTHYNLGIVYDKMGELEKAVNEYLSTIKLAPWHHSARNNLGIVYLRLGLPARAASEFQEALALSPTDPAYSNNLDIARGKLNKGPI